jgi:hypothetical protein
VLNDLKTGLHPVTEANILSTSWCASILLDRIRSFAGSLSGPQRITYISHLVFAESLMMKTSIKKALLSISQTSVGIKILLSVNLNEALLQKLGISLLENTGLMELAVFKIAFKYDLSCVLQQGNAELLQEGLIGVHKQQHCFYSDGSYDHSTKTGAALTVSELESKGRSLMLCSSPFNAEEHGLELSTEEALDKDYDDLVLVCFKDSASVL